MSSRTLAGGDTTFRVEQEYMEYTTNVPERDPDWRATDANGHEHFYSPEDDHYPTLEWIEDEPWWCEEHQELHEQGHWACRICGLEVSPGMRPPDHRVRSIPTFRHYFIDDQEVGEDEFKAKVAEAERRAETGA